MDRHIRESSSKTTTRLSIPRVPLFASHLCHDGPLAGSPGQELRSVESSDDCGRGGDTSSSRSLRPWPRTSPTPPNGAGEEDHEMHYTATVRTHPPPLAAGVQHFFLDDDEPPAAGSRPDRIATLSGPQERDLRRTVQQIVGAVPLVPLLDDHVPQMVEQLPDVMRFFDFLLPVPEQVIEVPKILLNDVPMRTAVRDTQLVEQLVEVPTIISCSSLSQRIMEQNVDIPVPGGGGGISGPQGFLPRQSPTALHGSQERISERNVDQNVEFPVGGGLQDFPPGQSSPASSSFPAGVRGSADGPGEGVFALLPN